MGYFAPDNIPADLFLSFVEDDSEEELGSTIQLLKQYSMVSLEEQSILNVHRLVQQVTRLKIKDQGNEKETLRKALGLVNKMMRRESVDHAVSVWNYAN